MMEGDAPQSITDSDKKMFAYQFNLNYMSRSSHEDRMKFLFGYFKTVRSFKSLAEEQLKTVLEKKKTKQIKENNENG